MCLCLSVRPSICLVGLSVCLSGWLSVCVVLATTPGCCMMHAVSTVSHCQNTSHTPCTATFTRAAGKSKPWVSLQLWDSPKMVCYDRDHCATKRSWRGQGKKAPGNSPAKTIWNADKLPRSLVTRKLAILRQRLWLGKVKLRVIAHVPTTKKMSWVLLMLCLKQCTCNLPLALSATFHYHVYQKEKTKVADLCHPLLRFWPGCLGATAGK